MFNICRSSLFSLGVHSGESFRFRVYLKDKGDSGYTLDNPEEYLSKESVERRNRQGISVSESDLPIAQAYLDTLSANGGKQTEYENEYSYIFTHRTSHNYELQR